MSGFGCIGRLRGRLRQGYWGLGFGGVNHGCEIFEKECFVLVLVRVVIVSFSASLGSLRLKTGNWER